MPKDDSKFTYADLREAIERLRSEPYEEPKYIVAHAPVDEDGKFLDPDLQRLVEEGKVHILWR